MVVIMYGYLLRVEYQLISVDRFMVSVIRSKTSDNEVISTTNRPV